MFSSEEALPTTASSGPFVSAGEALDAEYEQLRSDALGVFPCSALISSSRHLLETWQAESAAIKGLLQVYRMLEEDIRLNDECLDSSGKRSKEKDQSVLELRKAREERGGGGGAAGGAEKRVADLEAKNAELEKKLASEGTRRDEQVETIKKLANSRMANITKSFEEKLAAKERELEELRHTSPVY